MGDSEVIETPGIKTEEQVKQPKMYAVLVHNDPYTPRAFVVEVLQRYFGKNSDEASRIMLRAHKSCQSVVAVYTHEIAEMKAAQANKYSHDQGKLLLFSVQEA